MYTVNSTNLNLSNNFEIALKLTNYAICINLMYNTYPEEGIQLNTNFTYQTFNKEIPTNSHNVPEAFFLIHKNVISIIRDLFSFENYPRKLNSFVIIIPKDVLISEEIKQIFEANKVVKLKFLFILQEGKIIVKNHYKAEIESFSEIAHALSVLKSGNYNAELLSVTMFRTEPIVMKVGLEYLGIDPSVMNTLSQKLNFTVKYLEPPDNSRYGGRMHNGTTTGAINELYMKKAEITGNQVFLKWYNTPELIFTTTIFSDTLCVIVPKAATIPVWMNLFWIYTPEIWLVLVVNVFMFYGCLFLIQKLLDRVMDDLASNVFVHVARMVFNCPQHRKYLSVSDRIFQASILLFTTIFGTTFQSSLVTVIKLPKTYTEINTLEALDKSGYIPTTTSISLLDTFSNSTSPVVQSLDKKLTLVNGETEPLAFLERKSKMGIFQDADRILTGKTNFHIVKECSQEYLLSYMIRNDALFYEDLNKVLSGIFEAGLVKKWDGDLVRLFLRFKRDEIVKKDSIYVEDAAGFSLNDVQMSFYFWILGCLISLIVFLFEIWKTDKQIKK